ncbi:GroES-like protein [Xylaria bambusicola]|uniref:GroES-like protein n=1 Tax=Xylaria bambusicola TaxID=326684 RepID=UPI002007D657|nr:GroES-like protein [Xylaria bambusicola]KAI0523765.1 GroES-like protein [Xylaria bambusicola]
MATNKAIVLVEKGKAEIRELPLPKLEEGHILVKVHAVGVNPTDWKSVHGAEPSRFGSRLGCDFAGEVVEVGPGLTKNIKKGDRSAGFVFGASVHAPDNGAFGEYVAVQEHAQLKPPSSVTYEEAATFGVSVTTVGQGLYKTLQLPLPNNPVATPFPVLIYGGSTATGIYGIKYAKLSGLTVIATASPHNFDHLRSLGADHVFDYKSPTVGADIRALTGNKLKHAWDCTGFGASICAAALSDSEEGGRPKYATIIPVKREIFDAENPVVDGPHFTLGYDVFGVPYPRLGKQFVPDPSEVEYATMFWQTTQGLLESGKLIPLKPEVNRLGKGLEGVLTGLDELKNDRVSGTKLVYTL